MLGSTVGAIALLLVFYRGFGTVFCYMCCRG